MRTKFFVNFVYVMFNNFNILHCSVDHFYLEFVVNDLDRFQMLKNVFYALQKAKREDLIDSDDQNWLKFFDKQALENFWFPTKEEVKRYNEDNSRPPTFLSRILVLLGIKRKTRPNDKWLFDSMIYMIDQCEYDLTSCELIGGTKTASLRFNPLAGPYGGTGALRCLIEAFGFTVTKEDG